MNDYSKLKGLKIGITGSSGVLGTRLVQILSSHGANINCLVRQNSKIDNIKDLNPRITYGDITDKASLGNFVKDLDVCIHLAAMVGHGNLNEYKKVNVSGTRNLCNIIIENNPACRFINCSSITALRVKKGPKQEYTNYAKSKKLADDEVEKIEKEKGLRVTTIYPGLFYGPCDYKFVPTIMKNLKYGKMFFLTGGEKDAPIIYIDDLCYLFIESIVNEKSIGKKYIGIGQGEIGIHEFFKLIARKLSYPEPSKVFPRWLFLTIAIILEYLYTLLSIKKSPLISKRVVDILSINFRKEDYACDNDINWSPKINAEQGLNNFFSWYSTVNKEFVYSPTL